MNSKTSVQKPLVRAILQSLNVLIKNHMAIIFPPHRSEDTGSIGVSVEELQDWPKDRGEPHANAGASYQRVLRCRTDLPTDPEDFGDRPDGTPISL